LPWRRATFVVLDCTGELEGCTVVWTSHTDTETPFQLREKERKHKRECVPIRALYKGDANANTVTAV